MSGKELSLGIEELEELEHMHRDALASISQRIKQLRNEKKNSSLCVVCLERPKECALVPCGHKVCNVDFFSDLIRLYALHVLQK